MKNKIFGYVLALALLSGFHLYTTQAVTVLFPEEGGTGTSTVPISDQILYGTSDGIYQLRTISGSAVSTSTAGKIIISGGLATSSPFTANLIPFVLDPNTIAGSSTFVYTSSTGFLGIGTSTPAYLIHVYDNTATSTTSLIKLESAGLAGIEVDGDIRNVGGEPGGAYILFSTDNKGHQTYFYQAQKQTGSPFTTFDPFGYILGDGNTYNNSSVFGSRFNDPVTIVVSSTPVMYFPVGTGIVEILNGVSSTQLRTPSGTIEILTTGSPGSQFYLGSGAVTPYLTFNDGAIELSGAGATSTLRFANPATGFNVVYDTTNLTTQDQTATWANASGTVAFLDAGQNFTNIGTITGATTTLTGTLTANLPLLTATGTAPDKLTLLDGGTLAGILKFENSAGGTAALDFSGMTSIRPTSTNVTSLGAATRRWLQIFAGTSGISNTGGYTQTGTGANQFTGVSTFVGNLIASGNLTFQGTLIQEGTLASDWYAVDDSYSLGGFANRWKDLTMTGTLALDCETVTSTMAIVNQHANCFNITQAGVTHTKIPFTPWADGGQPTFYATPGTFLDLVFNATGTLQDNGNIHLAEGTSTATSAGDVFHMISVSSSTTNGEWREVSRSNRQLFNASTTKHNGDVYFTTSTKGVVFTTPNGSCFRMTMDNSAQFVTSTITCP